MIETRKHRLNEEKVMRYMRWAAQGSPFPSIRCRRTAGGLEVVDGHHRLEAAKRLGLTVQVRA